MKNVQSGTVQALLKAADCVKDEFANGYNDVDTSATPSGEEPYPELSKDQLEGIADGLRRDLDIGATDPLDSLKINVEGVRVVKLTDSERFDTRTMRKLRHEACSEWSAMSVPLDKAMTSWVVLLNDCHTVERQRVTLLEEYWHILMGPQADQGGQDFRGRTVGPTIRRKSMTPIILLPHHSCLAKLSRTQSSKGGSGSRDREAVRHVDRVGRISH